MEGVASEEPRRLLQGKIARELMVVELLAKVRSRGSDSCPMLQRQMSETSFGNDRYNRLSQVQPQT
jgi:hypothetical protein